MTTEIDTSNHKALHEVIDITIGNCYLQTQGVDVAIPYIVGAPGGGKTASIKGTATTHGFGMVSTHFALKPLEETGGIPQFENLEINGEKMLGTIWSFPDIMKHLYQTAEKMPNDRNGNKQMVIWLLDDMHLMSAIHNAMMYELLTERKLRDYALPENVAIVLAGNHASNKAGAKTMFSAIINRVALLPIFTSFDAWKTDFAIPNKIHPAIVSFLENDQYNQFFHEEEQVATPWGSPRAWSRLSNWIRAQEQWYNKTMKDDMMLYIAGGHVSKEAASQFQQYYGIFTKFDIEAILEAGDKYRLPDDPVDRYALAYALTSHFAGRKDRNTIVFPFSQILHKYIQDHQDLGLMVIHEIINIEKILNKRNLFISISNELNKIEPGITEKLLKEVTSV